MLPYMNDSIPLKGKSADVFRGINNTAKPGAGELTSDTNMSARNYPALAVRKGRNTILTAEYDINGAGVYNELYYTMSDDNVECKLVYGDNTASLGSELGAEVRRSFATISGNIFVLPDKKLYKPSDNTVTDLDISQTFTLSGAMEKARKQCNYKGSEKIYYLGNLYSDRIKSAYFSSGGYMSYNICPTGLSVGDVVHVSMEVRPVDALQDKHYRKYQDTMREGFFAKITEITSITHEIADGTKITDDYILYFDSVLDMGGYDEVVIEKIVISQKIPDLTYMCTQGNRIWGTEGNSIRSSALGKADVWYDFSADAYGTLPSSCYCAEVDSDGEFTGICSFNGSILAFKQNCIHKLYGTQPENYTLYTQSCTGVEPGCGSTLVIINGVVYYKGSDGFYAYSGGVPQCISSNIDLRGHSALGSASDGTNYYALMQNDDEVYLLVYYPRKDIWHKETISGARFLVGNSPQIYAVCDSGIVNLCDDNSTEEFDWSFEMCFDEDTYRYKQYTGIMIKYALDNNGHFTVTTQYDDNVHLSYITGSNNHTNKGCFTAELPPVRCREMKLTFCGRGNFELFDITMKHRLLSDKE